MTPRGGSDALETVRLACNVVVFLLALASFAIVCGVSAILGIALILESSGVTIGAGPLAKFWILAGLGASCWVGSGSVRLILTLNAENGWCQARPAVHHPSETIPGRVGPGNGPRKLNANSRWRA